MPASREVRMEPGIKIIERKLIADNALIKDQLHSNLIRNRVNTH